MDTAAGSFGVLIVLIGAVLAIVLIIAWIVLPLAVIGTKPMLREILDEVRRTNARLANMEAYLKYQAEVTKESIEAKGAPPPTPRRLLDDDSPVMRDRI